MLNDYEDIRKRLGEPLWFDEHGVPRYDPFTPRLCSVYPRFIALIEVACQSCGERFKVAIEWDHHDDIQTVLRNKAYPDAEPLPFGPIFPTANGPGSFSMGDPPRHDCVGDTMTSEDVAVLEFWRRDGEDHEWRRDKALEFLEFAEPLGAEGETK